MGAEEQWKTGKACEQTSCEQCQVDVRWTWGGRHIRFRRFWFGSLSILYATATPDVERSLLT